MANRGPCLKHLFHHLTTLPVAYVRWSCSGKKYLHTITIARILRSYQTAGWSSLVARQAHNLKVIGSNPVPATNSESPWLIYLGHGFFAIYLKLYYFRVRKLLP